jgi:plastocyanin
VTRPRLNRPLAWFAAAYAVLVVLALPSMILAEEPADTDLTPAPPTEQAPQPGTDPPSAAAEAPSPAAGPAAPAAPDPAGTTAVAASAAPAPASAGSRQEEARSDDEPVAFAASPGSVTIKDFSFSPASITVSVGETVTWQNSGPSGHSATARDGSFDTGVLDKGESRSHTFDKAGTFAYICTPHPFMHGTVKVVAAGGAGGGSASPPGGAGSSSGGSSPGDSTSSSSSGDSTGSGGEELASTGSDVWILACLGVLMLGLGIAVERRTNE